MRDNELVNIGWNSMENILDREMPVKKKRRGFFWLWYGLGLSLGLTLLAVTIFSFYRSFENQNSEPTVKTASLVEVNKKEITPNTNADDQSQIKTTEGSVNNYPTGNNSISTLDKSINTSKQKNKPSKKTDNAKKNLVTKSSSPSSKINKPLNTKFLGNNLSNAQSNNLLITNRNHISVTKQKSRKSLLLLKLSSNDLKSFEIAERELIKINLPIHIDQTSFTRPVESSPIFSLNIGSLYSLENNSFGAYTSLKYKKDLNEKLSHGPIISFSLTNINKTIYEEVAEGDLPSTGPEVGDLGEDIFTESTSIDNFIPKQVYQLSLGYGVGYEFNDKLDFSAFGGYSMTLNPMQPDNFFSSTSLINNSVLIENRLRPFARLEVQYQLRKNINLGMGYQGHFQNIYEFGSDKRNFDYLNLGLNFSF